MERKARLKRRRELRKAREMVLSEVAERLGEKLHNDDPTQYKEKIWQKINEFNGKPIPIGDLLDRPEKASCLLYTSPSPRDYAASRMPSSA